MQLGVVGLGRMGAGISRRLTAGGHDCVAYDRNRANVEALARDGAVGANSLEELVQQLAAPRAIWVMLPAGEPTEQTITRLGALLSPGDVVIDGGNTYYRDDIRRAKALAEKQIGYLDVGTSGGVWGQARGYCLMVGGDKAVFDRLAPIFAALAPGLGDIPRTARAPNADANAEHGFIHAGPIGAGHFVKMIHNGIEYGLMAAYAEGFSILHGKNAASLPEDERYDLNLADIAEVWRRGSVITSWLLDLTADALAQDGALEAFGGAVSDSGEGRWTLEAAIEEDVPAEVLAAALFARFRSRQPQAFSNKLLSAMRLGFGG
ncbi:MAG TPA: decarboxylating 6-phosphogluconate dehydrogenase, partial [Terricaulis sp.]|nr:decarboxylating 6-phosphogluconate dehydrogenase [Terricaulis sp.]